MRVCEHTRFDFEKTAGPGYVACAECGKSIPVEKALLDVDRRLQLVERALAKMLSRAEGASGSALAGGWWSVGGGANST